MVSKLFHAFEDFWTAISKSVSSKNCPTYHPCCKVWVSRSQDAVRASHNTKVSWRYALQSMRSPELDSKKLLAAHMLEHGWNHPIKLNFPCQLAVATPSLQRPAATYDHPEVPAQPEGAFYLFHPAQNRPSPRSTPAPAQLRESPAPGLSERVPVASECSSVCATCKATER